jgi:sulfotransferase family protein
LNYIQFIGTQRSGSNLLRVMLNQFPEISAPHPPHILKTFFPLLPLYGNLQEKQNFETLVQDVCDWVNANPVPWTGIVLTWENILAKCTERNLIEIFKVIYQEKALLDGAQIWCCKSMESIYHIREIEETGLRPFYIYIYRDGRDVALSFKKAIVGPKHIFHLAKKWKIEQDLSLKVIQGMDEARFIKINYEEFISHPEKTVEEIGSKLNLSVSASAYHYYHSSESHNTATAGRMWANLSKPVMADNFNKYKKELTEEEIRIFEIVAGDTLAALGYETAFWPFSGAPTFLAAELAEFDRVNKNLMALAIQSADSDELEKRKPQEVLLEKILNRSVNG